MRYERRAVTLVELTIVVLLTGGIMLTVGHVTTQITSGVANVDRRSQAQTETALALVRIRSELEYATAIVSLSSRQITFKHPDINGDSQVDTIAYEWSGTAGDPLTREINAGGKQPVLDKCRSLTLSAVTPPIGLEAGTRYPLKLEYYDNLGSATCSLRWSATGVAKQVVPSACLFPAFVNPAMAVAPLDGTGLTGQYYDNIDFTNPKLTRTDATIDFNWGFSAPVAWMGTNTFSVRWVGQIRPEVTGNYTFYVAADDGVRLWVNDTIVISNLTDRNASEDSGSSTGLSRVDVRIDAGSTALPVRLDGSFSMWNRPGRGS